MTAFSDKNEITPGAAPAVAHSRAARARLAPLTLLLGFSALGAALPAVQALRGPEPWRAMVLLSVDVSQTDGSQDALNAALEDLTSEKSLGRAVDLLALDRDPAFNGGKQTGVKVALELLGGQGAETTDRRRRAISTLAAAIGLTSDRAGQARLLVKASTVERATRIAEALATVFAASTETTGALPVDADSKQIDKAQAALAAYRKTVGEERLAEALVLRTRLDGLQRQLTQVSNRPDDDAGHAAVSLQDLIDGRTPAAESDPELVRLRRIFIEERLAVDALAVSLGPRHPQLIAARADLARAKENLAKGLQRFDERRSQGQAKRDATRAALQAEQATLLAAIDATGIDLGLYDGLKAKVEAARRAHAKPGVPGRTPLRAASSPSVLPAAQTMSLPLRMLFGGLSGLGAALAFSLARRSGPASRGTAAEPYRPGAAGKDATAGQPPAVVPDEPLSGWHGNVHGTPATDLPTVEKLKRVAPHVFATQASAREIDRLRQEIRDLRDRIAEHVSPAV